MDENRCQSCDFDPERFGEWANRPVDPNSIFGTVVPRSKNSPAGILIKDKNGDPKRYVTREEMAVVAFTTKEGEKFQGMLLPYDTARLFLSTVRCFGAVPRAWIDPISTLEGPSAFTETVPVAYCAIARIFRPEEDTWDSVLKAPRL